MNLHAGGDACFTTDGEKVFLLQTFTSGLNASRQLECPTKILTSINKAMKIIFILWKVRGTTGARRMLPGGLRVRGECDAHCY